MAVSWVEGCRDELLRGDTAQIDIDALLDPPPAHAVRAGIDILELAVAAARQIDASIGGTLAVPLAWAEQELPPLDHPRMAGLIGDAWTYGKGLQVPGLYLIHPEIWQVYQPVEAYEIGLGEPDLLPPGFVAYYRAWRTDEDRKLAPNEWNRTVYVRTI